MKRILTLLIWPLLFSTGCGIFGGKKDEVIVAGPPKISQSVPKPAPRELGSLWADDSRWNEIYAFTPARRVGDIVQIHVTDSLKFRIDQSMRAKDPSLAKKSVEKVAQGPAKPSDPDSADAKPEFNDGIVKQAPTPQAQKNDTAEIEGTILEIPSKGVYRVYANRPIAMGAFNPYVILDGHIRERDIKPNDSISSESIFNLKVDATNLKPGTEIKTAGANTEGQ